MARKRQHIVIDGRIRTASTGRPIDRLLEHLQDQDTDYRFTVLLAPGDDWTPSNRRFKTVTCRYKQFSFNPLQQIVFAVQLYRLKPDLVHFTLTGQQPLFYFGKQITFTHDLTMLKFTRAGRLPKWLHRIRMRAYRFLLWQSHHKAARITVPSGYVKGAVQTYHPFTRRKVIVTYEATEPPRNIKAAFPETLASYLPTPTSQLPFIMYVGTAFPHKNLRRLINSFELVLEKQPDLKLLLVGKQEYHSKRLQRWTAKKPYADSIIFTGFVSDAELKWLYEHARGYVFPSLSEGFGLPGLEAMAHGCPLISSNTTCLPEIYDDAAQYFDPRNIQNIAEAIESVLSSSHLREKLISEGYEQVKKYSWKKMTQETLAIYDEIL